MSELSEACDIMRRLRTVAPKCDALDEADKFLKRHESPVLAFRVVVMGRDCLVYARNRDRAKYVAIRSCIEAGLSTDKRKLFSTSRVRRAPEHDEKFKADQFEKCLEWSDVPNRIIRNEKPAFSFKF